MQILFVGDDLIDGDSRDLRNVKSIAYIYTISSLRQRIHFKKVNNYGGVFMCPEK
jgi:hypothetical protein